MAGKRIDNASLDESQSQYEKAVQRQKERLDSAKKVGDKAGEGTAYGNLGACYYFQGQYGKALEHYEKRLTIAKEIGDKKGKATAYGDLGVCYRALGQYSKAIAHQKMRVTIAKLIGDKEGEGAAYGDLGTCYRALGQYSKAIEHQEMRLTIAKQIGDKAGEGAANGNLGVCYHSLGLFRKALDYHEMSRTIAVLIGDKIDEQSCYDNLTVCYHSLGQYDKAIENQEKGLAIARELGDKGGEGTAYGNLGSCYHVRGQYYKAIEHYLMQLTIAKQTGDKASECSVHGNLGASFRALGKFGKALEHNEICLAIAKEIGDRAAEGAAYGYLGTCSYSLGQYEKATEHHKMKLTIAEQIGDKRGEGSAYGNLCACYYSLGQYEKAIEHNGRHLKIAKQIEDKAGEGVVYGNLGACYRALGQYSKAAEYHGKGLDIAREIGNKKSEGIACRSLGACYASADEHSKAIEYYEMSLTIAQQIGDTEVEGAAYASLGAYYNSRCQYDKAESNCTRSIECHERLFENAPKQDQFKVSILDTFITTYNLLLRILLIQGKREEALVLAERGRSRALADLIRTSHLVTCGDATETKVLDFHEICEVVTALESTVLYFRLLSPEICTWVIQPNDDLLFKKTGGRDSTQEFISDVQSLNSLIAKSRELIRSSTVECEDRSLSFLYEEQNKPKQTKNKERPPSPSATSAVLSVLKPGLPQDGTPCSATTTQSEYVTTSSRRLAEREHCKSEEKPQKPTLTSLLKDMYQIVLAPVQQFVKGPASVAVIPDGPIAMVPFAALVDGNENYVAESLQVRLIPSLATAKMIKERSQELKGEASPLIVGDPDVGEIELRGERINVPKLPHAKKEAYVIGALLKVQPLIAEQATKRNFLQRFESARLIHIAAHGDIERGEILFASSPGSGRRNIEEVMLRISDLEGKCTAAKLVVLSCCHSGRGEVRAEGVIGIARAFLGAGAAAVLVALWAVNDEATLFFMRKFYQHLLDGGRASEALGMTMKAMRETETFRHPRYWAPFVLIGEDVAPFGT